VVNSRIDSWFKYLLGKHHSPGKFSQIHGLQLHKF